MKCLSVRVTNYSNPFTQHYPRLKGMSQSDVVEEIVDMFSKVIADFFKNDSTFTIPDDCGIMIIPHEHIQYSILEHDSSSLVLEFLIPFYMDSSTNNLSLFIIDKFSAPGIKMTFRSVVV